MKHNRYPTLLLLLAMLLTLTACTGSTDEENEQEGVTVLADGPFYLNIRLVVDGANSITRGTPAGGEDGEGRETGYYPRENDVEGITLILYEAADGINTTGDERVSFIQYYRVKDVTSEPRPETGQTREHERVFARDSIKIEKSFHVDLQKPQHVLVVANQDLTGIVGTGYRIADLRDLMTDITFTDKGSTSNLDFNLTNFVMTSAKDYVLDFPSQQVGGVCQMDLPIERLSARIEFWMRNINRRYGPLIYYYKVWKSTDTTEPTSDHRFVLTAITPFNIYNGKEYLFKRIDEGGSTSYLGTESATSYVLDPNTSLKTSSSYQWYDNPLEDLIACEQNNGILTGISGRFTFTNVKDDRFVSFEGFEEQPSVILAYTKENTLQQESPLYYYATGLAIEGDYYTKSNFSDTPQHMVFYGFLRHQGEGTGGYPVYTKENISMTMASDASTPMNFGIVRNNIYRVYIDKIYEKTSVSGAPARAADKDGSTSLMTIGVE